MDVEWEVSCNYCVRFDECKPRQSDVVTLAKNCNDFESIKDKMEQE